MSSENPVRQSVEPNNFHETVPARFRLRTPQDILSLLEAHIVAVCSDPELGTLDKAKAITSLSRVALKAKEGDDLSNRIEALEATLNRRRKIR